MTNVTNIRKTHVYCLIICINRLSGEKEELEDDVLWSILKKHDSNGYLQSASTYGGYGWGNGMGIVSIDRVVGWE